MSNIDSWSFSWQVCRAVEVRLSRAELSEWFHRMPVCLSMVDEALKDTGGIIIICISVIWARKKERQVVLAPGASLMVRTMWRCMLE